jgi:hypothetical protein
MRGRSWAYTGAILGATVSIAANVAHAYVPPTSASPDWAPRPGSVAVAVFWPVALLVALEILARSPWPDGVRWLAVRWMGLVPVGVVAAIVSYRHLSALLGYYGEDAITVAIGPLAVDGLMLMASGALLATGDRVATVLAGLETAPSGPDRSRWTPVPPRDAPVPPRDAPHLEAGPVPVPDVSTDGYRLIESGGTGALEAARDRLLEAVQTGAIPTVGGIPSATAIRTYLHVGLPRARQLRDELAAQYGLHAVQ